MIPQSNNILAIEWDRNELRYLWAGNTGRRVSLRSMGRIAAADPSDSAESADAMLADLKEILRIKNAQVVVCMARADVEEVEATLPPATGHELLQLVANEAHKHWPTISDDAAIDFYELGSAPDGTKRLSIVVLSADRQNQLETAVKKLGWKLASIQLRHLAAVSLLRRAVELAAHNQSILVNLGRSDADLIVLESGQISLVRTIRLSPGIDRDGLAEQLSVEIQRSLMVTARPDIGDETGDRPVYFFGNNDEQSSLVNQLGAVLKTSVTVLDPLQGFSARPKELPERIHQFAAVLGSLFEQPRALTSDLKEPKCLRPVPTFARRLALYSSASAAVLGFVVWGGLSQVSNARSDNRSLKSELNAVQSQIEDLEKRTSVVEYVDDWRADDFNWLEELRELSERFPERSLVQAKSMSMTIGSSGAGIISMNLRARDDVAISRLEQSIRDEHHQVRTNQLSQSVTDEEFPWQFGATIVLDRRERDEFLVPGSTHSTPGTTSPNPGELTGQPSNSASVKEGKK